MSSTPAGRRLGAAGAVGPARGRCAPAACVAERKVVARAPAASRPGGRRALRLAAADRTSTVTATDGVELYVEEVGAQDAPLTLVFCHGYTLEMACWHFQRQDAGRPRPAGLLGPARHGRSGRSTAENCTIDQLGSDLEQVIEAAAPDGPVVLVGHSMGGMTIMALAAARPDLFLAGGRVVGVALLATSAGELAQVSLGLPSCVARLTGASPSVWVGLGKRASFIEPVGRALRRPGEDAADHGAPQLPLAVGPAPAAGGSGERHEQVALGPEEGPVGARAGHRGTVGWRVASTSASVRRCVPSW